ncbi:cytochrome P450 [Aulographum hederae CBS 113979]|uniref:Cytochrome P450 n=1 Tax=Aulographum hederae CBS 113979 TaxID=1176131 RepID=A0A6G1HAG9_9PEZI|nr:cytochrome P450 [Aulographum hederae CBS 113979]
MASVLFSVGLGGVAMGVVKVVGAGVGLTLLYLLLSTLYNLLFHPLRHFPGPPLWRASRLPWVYHNSLGRLPFAVKALHDTYGPIVRIAPDELSFIDGAAWKPIYGGTDSTQLDRDEFIYPPENQRNLPNSIIHADHVAHARIRRRLAYAFSTKALESQEGLMFKHIDLLLSKLATAEGPVNMSDWFNFASLDIIGDLALGESLGCLEKGEYHPLAKHLIGAFKAGILMSSVNRFIPVAKLKFLLRRILPKKTLAQNKNFLLNLHEQVNKRMAIGVDSPRPDFISYMLAEDKTGGSMTKMDIQANTAVFFIGGSESSASLMSGTLYHLLQTPSALARAVAEIRENFASADEIHYRTVSTLPYLLACMEEGLRVATPTPFGICRRTKRPMEIAGVVVPGNTSVAVPQWAAFHSAKNWRRSEEFVPERWLPEGEEEFGGDKREVFQPFGVGPRNCMGKSLAYVEMRILFARLLYTFDFSLPDNNTFVWSDQRAFISWQKLPFYVNVKTVNPPKIVGEKTA